MLSCGPGSLTIGPSEFIRSLLTSLKFLLRRKDLHQNKSRIHTPDAGPMPLPQASYAHFDPQTSDPSCVCCMRCHQTTRIVFNHICVMHRNKTNLPPFPNKRPYCPHPSLSTE